jgi:hypothetical protein
VPVVVALVLAGAYLALGPPSADLAAQTYRVGLFDRAGLALWDNGWYAGHHVLAYSVVAPPLGAWLGIALTAALAVVAATLAFAGLARDRPGARGAGAWFAVAIAAAVVSGRVAFAVGAALGLAAALAAHRGRPRLALALGAATACGSPVAALFLALAAASVRTRAWLLAGGAAVAVTAALVLAFPEGGSEPFVASAFWPALAAALLGAALAPAGPLRTGALLYALVVVAAFAVPNPLGGNAARLGALLAGPLAVLVLWPGRRRALALLALPLAYWTAYPAARDWIEAHGDPAVRAGYYAPLLAELRVRGGAPARLEIPFTARHWEAAHVAAHVPLARGWERQLDRKENALFYAGDLTAARYRAWLDDRAVRWVALPDAALDASARAEAALLRAGVPGLREVWRSAHWRLFENAGAAPLGVTRLGPEDFDVARAAVVRVRFSPWFAVVRGRGCVARAPGGWTRVEAGGPVTVGLRLAPGRLVARGRRCAV